MVQLGIFDHIEGIPGTDMGRLLQQRLENPVTAGRYGMGLVWPGPIPQDAYDLYVESWDKHKDDPVRADGPESRPRVGATMLIGIGDTTDEGKSIAARGVRGLMRRIVVDVMPNLR